MAVVMALAVALAAAAGPAAAAVPIEAGTLLPTASPPSAASYPSAASVDEGGDGGLTASATAREGFDVTRAMTDLRALVLGAGVRGAGSAGERRAGDYIAGVLGALGYEAGFQGFPLPNTLHSRNVVATLPGAHADTLVLGAHYDSKPPSPGANDNGTGVAALLELARVLADEPLDVTVRFVFFGAEETIDSNPDHHHYGSRHYVASLSTAERERTRGMLSIDMIGYGPEFRVRTMGVGPPSLKDRLLALARQSGSPLSYLRDPGQTGWSDHEPFELAGIPAAWLEWRDDPWYHTAADGVDHVDPTQVRATGDLVLAFTRGLTAEDLRFHDLAAGTTLRTAVLDLAQADVVSGYRDNTFRPEAPLYRAQFAKMLTTALGSPVDESLVSSFVDLADDLPGDLYPHDYVAAATRDGLVRGYADNTFRPYASVTRAQVVTMAVRALQRLRPGLLAPAPVGVSSSWSGALGSGEHETNARLAESNGLLRDLPLARDARDPWQAMPRGEAALVLWRVRQALQG